MARLNENGRRNLEAIVSGFIADQVERFGGGTIVEVRRLPDLTLVSTWAVGRNAMDRRDADALWRELRDGRFLWAAIQGPSIQVAEVTVERGVVVAVRPLPTVGDLVTVTRRSGDDSASTSPRRSRRRRQRRYRRLATGTGSTHTPLPGEGPATALS